MKALSLIAGFFAAFLIILGVTSRENNGDVLGFAAIIGGVLILIFISAVWILASIKKNKSQEEDSDDFDS